MVLTITCFTRCVWSLFRLWILLHRGIIGMSVKIVNVEHGLKYACLVLYFEFGRLPHWFDFYSCDFAKIVLVIDAISKHIAKVP